MIVSSVIIKYVWLRISHLHLAEVFCHLLSMVFIKGPQGHHTCSLTYMTCIFSMENLDLLENGLAVDLYVLISSPCADHCKGSQVSVPCVFQGMLNTCPVNATLPFPSVALLTLGWAMVLYH